MVNHALEGDPLTEDKLALRFSERHAETLRYVAVTNTWFRWDGRNWRPEETTLAFDLARISCRSDAETYGNGRPPSSVYSAKTVAAVERMAKADRRQAATLDQWDTLDLLFNTGGTNGMPDQTFDLSTGKPQPPGAPHPAWSAFLNRILPDIETQKFLQRFVGYCCTGITTEHVFVFAYGTG